MVNVSRLGTSGKRLCLSCVDTPRKRYWLLGALALVTLLLAGGTELELRFQSIESWLRELGPAGLIVFALLYATVTSVLLPDSLFRVAAGALFGYVDGLTGVVLGTLLASLLQFAIARIFTTRIQHVIATRPTLERLQRGVLHSDLRLQFMIRLTPINPAMVSYLLAASGVSFLTFLAALPGMLPSMLIEVWVGHAGRHVTRLASGQSYGWVDLVKFGALACGIAAMVFVAHAAHKAVTAAMSESHSE